MAESVESSDTDDWISELTTAHREVAAMPESPDSSDTDAWILELTTAHVPQDATANLPQDATANLPQDATTHLPQDVTHDAPQANLYIYIYIIFLLLETPEECQEANGTQNIEAAYWSYV